MNKLLSTGIFATGLFATSVALAPSAYATEFLDPNFSVCAYGTADVSSCGPQDPQLLTNQGLSTGVIGNAPNGPLDPFLIFAAVPSLPTPEYLGNPAPAPTFAASAGLTISLANQVYYTQTTTPVNGYLGELSATSTANDVYTLAGMPAGNNSVNFSNLSGGGTNGTFLTNFYNATYGAVPTSFSIYEFVVNVNATTDGTNLSDANVYNLLFHSVAAGTYFASWAIDTNPPPERGNATVYDSAFTTAGFTTNSLIPPQEIPEPAVLSLLGLGLVALGWTVRRGRP